MLEQMVSGDASVYLAVALSAPTIEVYFGHWH